MVSTKFIPKHTYICQYQGELLEARDAVMREKEYSEDDGCYMFYFFFKGKKYW